LALNLAALGAVAALMAHSVVDFNMHIPGNALLYAFIFGILANPSGGRLKEPPRWLSSTTAFRLLLVLAGAGTLVGVVPKYKGEQLAEQARVALRDNQPRTCVEVAQQAIREEPENPDSYFYLGESNRGIGMGLKIIPLRQSFLEKAVAAFRQGLERFPGDERSLVRLGQALDGLNRYDEADAAYQEAIQHDPSLGILYAYYAAHFKILGMTEAAQKCYKAANSFGAENAAQTGMSEVRSILEIGAPDPK
jgi:tetratricopeptide (TPR) repeat protein